MDQMQNPGVTRILDALGSGDSKASAELLSLVYEELRKLAAQRLASEGGTSILQPTALVHEVYLRLVGPGGGAGGAMTWKNRAHFFSAAAESMRRILVDRARERRALKRGGNWRKLDLDVSTYLFAEVPPEIADLDMALSALAAEDPSLAELVKLRFYIGLSHPDVAELMGVSIATIDRRWAYARAWLFRYLEAADRSHH